MLNTQTVTSPYQNELGALDKKPTFIDVFAGCGGLSLGFMQAGWTGLFAVEQNAEAFETLTKNLANLDAEYCFQWPEWLPCEPRCITQTIAEYKSNLAAIAGTVDIVIGGPPCQGYSSAGRRNPDDPRNMLFESYIEIVKLVKPKLILIENVRGITLDFKDKNQSGERINYAEKLVDAMSELYTVHHRMLNVSDFGVPQNRHRFFLIGYSKDYTITSGLPEDPFTSIEKKRFSFLMEKGLTPSLPSKAAISDLEVTRNGVVHSKDTKGFNAIDYKEPITPYQKLMRAGCSESPEDTRLPNHKQEIAQRFRNIIDSCHAEGRLNVSLGRELREAYGLKKQSLSVLDPNLPSPTITSMPDDLLHYSEARTLTVRENARLQSFPDWFQFRGSYTTGGQRRKFQIPRYTQVANAVPPLAAEAIGLSLLAYARELSLPVPECVDTESINLTEAEAVEPVIIKHFPEPKNAELVGPMDKSQWLLDKIINAARVLVSRGRAKYNATRAMAVALRKLQLPEKDPDIG